MSILNKLVSRVEMMLAKAVIKAVNDTDDIQLVKISILAGETQDGVERLQNYGFSSVPPNGSEAFVGYLNGNRDHGVVLVVDNGEHRPRNLKDGESVFYSKHGQTVLLNENGEYVFEGGTDFGVKFDELKTAFDQLKSDHDSHIHLAGAILDGDGAACTGATAAVAVGSTANINPAKVTKVRLP